jgi:CopG family nickel-responsive transcriptional regulator
MKNIKLTRFGISMSSELLATFDRMITRKGFPSRSEAIEKLIRNSIIEEQWESDSTSNLAGTITLIYDHEIGELKNKLTEIQHDHHSSIISTMHLHLDKHKCLEVLVVRGIASDIKKLYEKLSNIKGVLHSRLSTSAV